MADKMRKDDEEVMDKHIQAFIWEYGYTNFLRRVRDLCKIQQESWTAYTNDLNKLLKEQNGG